VLSGADRRFSRFVVVVVRLLELSMSSPNQPSRASGKRKVDDGAGTETNSPASRENRPLDTNDQYELDELHIEIGHGAARESKKPLQWAFPEANILRVNGSAGPSNLPVHYHLPPHVREQLKNTRSEGTTPENGSIKSEDSRNVHMGDGPLPGQQNDPNGGQQNDPNGGQQNDPEGGQQGRPRGWYHQHRILFYCIVGVIVILLIAAVLGTLGGLGILTNDRHTSSATIMQHTGLVAIDFNYDDGKSDLAFFYQNSKGGLEQWFWDAKIGWKKWVLHVHTTSRGYHLIRNTGHRS
jgi:hypothetical protein